MCKIINIVIEKSCYKCPYCQYNENYYDEGYDCEHDSLIGNCRIVDAHEIVQYRRCLKKWEKSFPVESEKPVDPMKFPDWCPLDDYKKA